MNKAKEISALWKQIKPQIGELARLCHEVESHYEVTADAYQRGYEQGLSDAWDAAKKTAYYWIWSGGTNEAEEIFGTDDIVAIFKNYSASVTMEKIRQYEQGKEEIIDPDKNKVEALANDIGIHKLFALVKEIRGE